jgi:hypothetical protein
MQWPQGRHRAAQKASMLIRSPEMPTDSPVAWQGLRAAMSLFRMVIVTASSQLANPADAEPIKLSARAGSTD